MIEDTTYEECVDIINSYIENWINDDNDLIPIFSNGVELSEKDFEFTDYMDIYEKESGLFNRELAFYEYRTEVLK